MSEEQTPQEAWDRGRTLLLESLYKPDTKLRGCAYNQQCYDELMEIRDDVIDKTRNMINPRVPKSKFGEKNDLPNPSTMTPSGEISDTLLSGALGDYYKNGGNKDEQ